MKKILDKFKKKYLLIALLLMLLNGSFFFIDKSPIDSKSKAELFFVRSSFEFSRDDYSYYKNITILASQVSGVGYHSDFPVLISLTDSDLRDQCQADGDDIAFYDGTILLDFEVEYYNSGTGTLIAWVRIPSLSTTTNTNIQMYYSNPALFNSEANPTGVWDENFKGVWHLGENIGTIAIDSTSNHHDGFHQGNPSSQEGKIGNAQNFDGNDDYIDTGKLPSELEIGGNDPRTVSAWVDTSLFNGGGIFDSGSYNSYDGIEFCLRTKDKFDPYENGRDNDWRVQFRGFPEFDFDFTYDSLNKWVFFTITYDGFIARIYADGVEISNRIVSLNTLDDLAFRMGLYNDNSYFEGKIDEMRVSNMIRSLNWISTEYNNQNHPNNFYIVGNSIPNTHSSDNPEIPPSEMNKLLIIFFVSISAFITTTIIGSIKRISNHNYNSKKKYFGISNQQPRYHNQRYYQNPKRYQDPISY